MATNMILANAYVLHRRHDGFVLKRAFFAAFGNLLTVATVCFLMQPNAAAFGVIASEGAAFVFLVSAFLKGVSILRGITPPRRRTKQVCFSKATTRAHLWQAAGARLAAASELTLANAASTAR
jgi:hypothetical protein